MEHWRHACYQDGGGYRLWDRKVKIMTNLLAQSGTAKSHSWKGVVLYVYILQNLWRISCGLFGFIFAIFNPALFHNFLFVILQICAFYWPAYEESSPRAKTVFCFLFSLSMLVKCLVCWHFPHSLWMNDLNSDICLISHQSWVFQLGKATFPSSNEAKMMRLKCFSFPAFSQQAFYFLFDTLNLLVLDLYQFLASLGFWFFSF